MGTCFFMVQIYLSSCIVVLILLLLIRYAKVYKLQNIYEKLKQNLFWSTALRFIFESYLELVICITVGMLNLEWSQDNFSMSYNTLWTLSFAFIALILPLFTSFFYYCRIDQVDDEQFTKKYGTLYEGLQLDMDEDKRKSALIFPFLFLLRRLAFTAVVIWLDWFVWA